MARDAAKVGRWREGGPSRGPAHTGPTSARKWVGTAIVSAMLAAALGVFVWLCVPALVQAAGRALFRRLLGRPVRPARNPPDRLAGRRPPGILDDKVFPNADPRAEDADRPTLEVMQEAAQGPRRPPATRTWSCTCRPTRSSITDKKIQILAADSVPYETKTQLPLSGSSTG